MRKLLLCFAICALALTGCFKQEIDYASAVDYLYVNECSSEITIRAFSYGGKERPFTIPVKGVCKISLAGFGFPFPFNWEGGGSYHSYVIISNGEKTVTQRGDVDDELFLTSSYITISKDDYNATLLYVFTDDFFEDGESGE